MKENKIILVTGGTGYIGSHTVIELLENKYDVVIIDNLKNSSIENLNRIEKITQKKIKEFFSININDEENLEKVFLKYNNFYSVIHFAGLKAVGESVYKPIDYYETNIGGTITLLKVMKKFNIKNIIYSSSATVYGNIENIPKEGIREDSPTQATSPYGRTKLFNEEFLKDIFKSDPEWNIVILRYFNPVGAHPSGLIGESPLGTPNNLMPYVAQVACGIKKQLNIFGNDYPTKDGTGIRDYIHVVDVAKGHIVSLSCIEKKKGYVIFNLGTGIGYSVLDMVNTMKKITGKDIPYEFVERRPGDVAICFSCPTKAEIELKWKAIYNIEKMCEDLWRWQSNNLFTTQEGDK